MEHSNSPKTLKSSLSKPVKPYKKEEPKLPFKLVGDKKDHPRLIHLLNRLCESETGYYQLKNACEGGFSLGFEAMNNSSGICMTADSLIVLNPQCNDDLLVETLSHETKHACQYANGWNENLGVENIKSELIKFRALEADAETSTITCCYELYQKGDTEPYLKFGEKRPYIKQAFEKALKKSKGTINNDVKTTTFCSWYDDSRLKIAYEAGYHINFMQNVIDNDFFISAPYSSNITSEEQINKTCIDQNGCYFLGDKNCLESGKFLDVDPKTKASFKLFFNLRKRSNGEEVDPTLKKIPTRKKDFFTKCIKYITSSMNKSKKEQKTNTVINAVKDSLQKNR